MFPELNVYLSGLIPQEATRRLLYSLEVLQTHQGDTVFVMVDNYMMSLDEQDSERNLNMLYDLITTEQITLLKTFGIFVNEDTFEQNHHYDLALLLDALSQIETYEDPTVLLDIINIHEDHSGLFNELVQTITQTDHFCEYETLISKVNDRFLLKLTDILSDRVDNLHLEKNEEEQEEPSISQLLPKLMEMKDRLNLVGRLSDIEVAQTLLKAPGTLSIESILRLYGNRLADQENAEWMWIIVLFSARCEMEINHPDTLFNLWGSHFLSDVQQLTMRNKVKALHDTLLEQFKHPEVEYQL